MDHSLKQLRDNWVILTFIVMLIVSWTTFNNRLAQAESKINDLTDIVSSVNELNVRVAVVQADISYIKANLK